MSKWPKKPLLAVLAALTAVGLGVPCAMADGTAAATAYISVEAAGGTTLDGRTYKAYRLGSYGKTDVRVDQDSGDRYGRVHPRLHRPGQGRCRRRRRCQGRIHGR